ncbi:amidohydrolase family protein [Kineosporia succinea]|uniref:TIM-barrel fold metal-dependent hydrolase n=1 Tax=Kineosporia succinea TaxID=84632 RepID=A0ABT9PCD3_9ACTN|nr:amidohydrolase family protein [Kineosporia succinea]MDP9830366.1 putative TIM-barrel fold metal-dependent hydrolase [Kineosporia succinea]
MKARIPIVDVLVPVTPEGAVKDISEVPPHLRVPSILNPLSLEQLLQRMDHYGIGQSVIPARKYGQHWGMSYEFLRDFVAKSPNRLFATAGIDPLNKMPGVRLFEEAVRDFGFVGAHTYSSWSQVPADDRLYYPYYAKAEELGVPFQVECMAAKAPRSMGHPQFFDRVAADFPDLKLVATHCGYPWERELMAYAEFRPNFYVGADGFPTDLWHEDLIRFIKGTGFGGQHPWSKDRSDKGNPNFNSTSNRAVFATNYMSMDLEQTFADIDAMDFSDEIRDKLFAHNGRRLFSLPELEHEMPAPGTVPLPTV